MNTKLHDTVCHDLRKQCGFSLVEVVFALAIASLGFLTLLGLLPSGLEMARNSADLSAEARITQLIGGELQSTAWDELDWSGYGRSRLFNDQGVEIPAASVDSKGPGYAAVAYVVSVNLPASAMDVRLPADGVSASAQKVEGSLRRAKICIVPTSDPGFKFEGSGAASRRVRAYTVMLSQSNG